MDPFVRYWDSKTKEVGARYFTSVVLEGSKVVDLKERLKEAVGEDNLRKILQISMDGPAVNFKMLKQLQIELSGKSQNNSILLKIGICGVHNVHSAFKAGDKN